MKRILIALAVVIALGLSWYAWQSRGEEKLSIMPAVSRPDPSDATFIFEDGPVTLEDGRASAELAPGSVFNTDTAIEGELVYGDVNGDEKNDTALILAQTGGGSGVFIYVAAYVSGNVAYKGTNAVFVGDRVSPQLLSIDNDGVITLTYLDRSPEEAMASAPTVPQVKSYVYRDGRLEER